MATVLDSIKEANTEFLKVMRSQGGLPQIDKQPSKHVAIISCMDTRLLYIFCLLYTSTLPTKRIV